jgi:hypothetical protein
MSGQRGWRSSADAVDGWPTPPRRQLRAGADPAIVPPMSSQRERNLVLLSRLIPIAGRGGLLLLRPARR